MKKLLLHPTTRSKLDSIISSTPQSILITGKPGSGKYTLGIEIASEVLGINSELIYKQPYFLLIDELNGNISIDLIRSINEFLKLRVPDKNNSINRVVLISNAQSMRTEAQNALLKTLEEPPKGTMLILTSDDKKMLLSTIYSRTQELDILPISLSQAEEFYDTKNIKLQQLSKLHALASGQAGLLDSLLNDESHRILKDIELVKQILADSKGKRLYRVDDLAKDKIAVKGFLDALLRISHAALISSSKKNNIENARKWQIAQDKTLKSIERLNSNVQTKLVLDDLLLSI